MSHYRHRDRIQNKITHGVDLVVVQGNGSTDSIVKVADLGVDGLVSRPFFLGEGSNQLLDSRDEDLSLGRNQFGHCDTISDQ